MKTPNYALKFLSLAALTISVPAFSEDFCVTNTAELNQALLLSSVNNQDDVIKMEQGTNIVETSGFFGNGFEYLGGNEDFDLEISGGWINVSGNPCAQQINDPRSTILDGDGFRRVLNIEMGMGDVTLTNFWIFDGHYTGDLFVAGGGLKVNLQINSTARIERVVFSDNYAPQVAALAVGGIGRVYLKNSLIVTNASDDNDFVATLSAHENYAINNTVMFNTGSGLRVALSASLESKAMFVNNIFRENDASDYAIFGGEDTEVYLYNNNLGVQLNDLPVTTVQADNISVAPHFEPGYLNFTPASGSPVINTGKSAPTIVPVPTPFKFAWNYGLLDLEGADRVNNNQVDIGAIEAPVGSLADLIFADDFE